MLLGVEHPVPVHDPAEVAGTERTQPRLRRRALEGPSDPPHRRNHRRLLGRRQRLHHGGDLSAGRPLQRLEGVVAPRGEPERVHPPVGVGGPSDRLAARDEAAEGPAEVPGIEAELASELPGRQAPAMRQLVEHAQLGRRVVAGMPALVQHPEPRGVEPAEGADLLDGFLLHVHPLPSGAGRLFSGQISCLSQLIF